MPCRRPVVLPAGQRNRPGLTMAYKRFFPVVAGALLLLADAGRSIGGCIDDPCKFPSLGYPFESSPSFHHRRDDASGTFCAPCYAYRPTCWREWPECCVGCPPPAGLMLPGVIGNPMIASPTPAPNQPAISRPAPLPTLPPPVSMPMLPPAEPQILLPPDVGPTSRQTPAVAQPPLPPEPKSEPAIIPVLPPVSAPVAPPPAEPQTSLPPDVGSTPERASAVAQPPLTPVPKSEPAISPVPQSPTAPQPPQHPAGSARLPLPPMPIAKPQIYSHVDRAPGFSGIPRMTELPEAPMPPRTTVNVQQKTSALAESVPRVFQNPGTASVYRDAARMGAKIDFQDLGIAPMPPGVRANIVLTSASPPMRVTRPEEDLGIAPMPPGLEVARISKAKRVVKSSAQLDLAPMPPELPRMTQLIQYPLAPMPRR